MSQIPVACVLDATDQSARRDEWRALIAPNLVLREAVPKGVRLVLRRSPKALDELRRLIGLEKACCSWINWSVEDLDSELHVEATADRREGVQTLQEWYLSPGQRHTEAS